MGTPLIVFCDLDDSFLARDKSIPERNRRMLDILAERGIPFVPSTGRAFAGIPRDIVGHPAVRHAITSTGAAVIDVESGEAIASWAVGAERALALFGLVRDLNATFDLFADGSIWAERERYERLPGMGIDEQQTKLMLKTRSVYDGPLEAQLARLARVDRVGMFFAAGERGRADKQRAIEAVSSIGGLRAIEGHPLGLEIVDAGASKGVALAWLCEHLGIDVARSIAFGDSGNDADMLAAAGTGVALLNAAESAKEVADAICALDCDAGGVAQVLEAALGLA